MPFHLLVLSQDGVEDILVDDVVFHIPRGGVYLIPAGSLATIGSPLGNTPVFVHFDLTWDGHGAQRAAWNWLNDPQGKRMPPVQPPPAQVLDAELGVRPPAAIEAELRRRLPAVVRCWSRGDALSVADADNQLEHLLIAWAAQVAVASGDAALLARIARAEAVAMQQLDRLFSVADFAAASGWSRSRFHDIYVRLRHQAPGDFLRQARIDVAKAMLAQDRPLSEIAEACGFTDRTAFSRFFRRSCGVPPGRWRSASG